MITVKLKKEIVQLHHCTDFLHLLYHLTSLIHLPKKKETEHKQ